MRENNKVCGTCLYHKHDKEDSGWVCTNNESDYCAAWTEYNDSCEEWEGRE